MRVANDSMLDIAIGSSSKTKTWKNKKIAWSELLDRLAEAVRTQETTAEYRKMSREEQSRIKDVGGFVGGYCSNGRRSLVKYRQLVCLDADFATMELWDEWELIYGCAAAMYSTHKHTAEKPRLRLVIPLDRKVTPDEYQAIARRLAADLGIDRFDDTTYQPQRLMYWPSVSKDGEYVFEYLDAAFVSADEILATYEDWKDISSWPMSSRMTGIPKGSAGKQKDPLQKEGLVGVFCRTYTIQAAIEKFIDAYQAVPGMPGRYTYTEGSTAAGVVTYEDRFSYSHHGTDPASGVLCNAWDLVRLHKFHALDEDAQPGTAPGKLPSFQAMTELALADDAVRVMYGQERLDRVSGEFEILEDENDNSWLAELTMTAKGGYAQTMHNVVKILEHDPRLKGRIEFNEFEHVAVSRKDLPWRKIRRRNEQALRDSDDANLRLYIEQTYGISGRDKINDAVTVVAGRHSFHPVKEYLEGCAWDGEPRLDRLLIDYLGADDTAYVRAVTRKTFTAAVARIYEPGCKFDTMLTIKGQQGIGKSSLARRMAGEWFSDSLDSLKGKEAYEQVQGAWILELGELTAMRKTETDAMKQFLSKSEDRYRVAYGRRVENFPRQCIFIGTTNEDQFLRDATGNRRFWVVDTPGKASRSVFDLTDEDVRQLWGEAIYYYKAGEPLYLSQELERVARDTQVEYEEEHPKAGLIHEYLDRLLPANWDEMDANDRWNWLQSDEVGTVRRDQVCVMEVWAEVYGGAPVKLDYYGMKEIRDILKRTPGWRYVSKQKRFKLYGQQRYFERWDFDADLE